MSGQADDIPLTELPSASRARRALLGTALGLGATAAWKLKTTLHSGNTQPAEATGSSALRIESPPGSRHSDQIPDVTLTTQSGRSVRLYSDLIRDSNVILSFFYCQCNGICPATSGLFSKLRKSVPGYLRNDVKFISLTLDPENDSPAALSKYAAAFNAENELRPAKNVAPWYFLTGTPEDIESVRIALGYRDPDPVRDADRSQHAAMFTFGNDATNRWGTLPVGLNEKQTLFGILRTLGTSSAERFAVVPRPT